MPLTLTRRRFLARVAAASGCHAGDTCHSETESTCIVEHRLRTEQRHAEPLLWPTDLRETTPLARPDHSTGVPRHFA